MIGSNLHRYYEGYYIVPDLETEGLTLRYNRPWQCAWMLCQGKKVLWTKTRYIWWADLNISADAARITRFNRLEYTRQAKPAAEVLAEFDADLYNPAYKNVWHNPLGFDIYPHDYWRHCCGQSRDFSYTERLIDTNCLSKAYLKGIKPDTTNLLAWQYKMADFVEKGLKSNVGAMCKTFGLPFDEAKAHDGPYDIDRTNAIHQELLYRVEF